MHRVGGPQQFNSDDFGDGADQMFTPEANEEVASLNENGFNSDSRCDGADQMFAPWLSSEENDEVASSNEPTFDSDYGDAGARTFASWEENDEVASSPNEENAFDSDYGDAGARTFAPFASWEENDEVASSPNEENALNPEAAESEDVTASRIFDMIIDKFDRDFLTSLEQEEDDASPNQPTDDRNRTDRRLHDEHRQSPIPPSSPDRRQVVVGSTTRTTAANNAAGRCSIRIRGSIERLKELCAYDTEVGGKPRRSQSIGSMVAWLSEPKRVRHAVPMVVFCVHRQTGELYLKVASAREAFSLAEAHVENLTVDAFGPANRRKRALAEGRGEPRLTVRPSPRAPAVADFVGAAASELPAPLLAFRRSWKGAMRVHVLMGVASLHGRRNAAQRRAAAGVTLVDDDGAEHATALMPFSASQPMKSGGFVLDSESTESETLACVERLKGLPFFAADRRDATTKNAFSSSSSSSSSSAASVEVLFVDRKGRKSFDCDVARDETFSRVLRGLEGSLLTEKTRCETCDSTGSLVGGGTTGGRGSAGRLSVIGRFLGRAMASDPSDRDDRERWEPVVRAFRCANEVEELASTIRDHRTFIRRKLTAGPRHRRMTMTLLNDLDSLNGNSAVRLLVDVMETEKNRQVEEKQRELDETKRLLTETRTRLSSALAEIEKNRHLGEKVDRLTRQVRTMEGLKDDFYRMQRTLGIMQTQNAYF